MLHAANPTLATQLQPLLPLPTVRSTLCLCDGQHPVCVLVNTEPSQPLPSLPPDLCMVVEDAAGAARDALLEAHAARLPCPQVHADSVD